MAEMHANIPHPTPHRPSQTPNNVSLDKDAAVEAAFTNPLLTLSSIPPPIFCSIAPFYLSFGLGFLRTTRFVTYFGLSKEQRLWPSFSYVAILFSAPCLPALIHLSLSLVGLVPFGLCVYRLPYHDIPDILLFTYSCAS